MLNLVDSCGWLEYFADGPNAAFFSRALNDEDKLVVPTMCVLEVFKRVLAQRGEREALAAAAAMTRGRVVDLTVEIALTAAKLGVERRLPMADSVILATVKSENAVLWTQDSHFKSMPRVRYVEKKS